MVHKGISGFILKSARLSEVEKAIQTVLDGMQYYSPELVTLLTNKIRKSDNAREIRLTPRETQVLRLLCKGKSTTAIANELVLSTRTVEGCRAKLLQKSGQTNTVKLIFFALQQKLVSQDDIFSTLL
jgi:DNA-binding NarL/FixJ family response regulator